MSTSLPLVMILLDYNCDLSFVYFREDHELYRTWVGVVNDKDPESIAMTGYIKISIQVVGPNDKLKVHDEAEDKKKEKEAKSCRWSHDRNCNDATINSTRGQKLKTTIYRCEYLPMTDDGVMASSRGIDAYITVAHGTNKPFKTKTISMSGSDRQHLNPSFNTEIWLPVTVPTSSQNIKVTVMDQETLALTRLWQTYHKFGELQSMEVEGDHFGNLCMGLL